MVLLLEDKTYNLRPLASKLALEICATLRRSVHPVSILFIKRNQDEVCMHVACLIQEIIPSGQSTLLHI